MLSACTKKTNYITITGQTLPIRYTDTCRNIDLTSYLSDYLQKTEVNSLVEFFEDYWNEFFDGVCGYTVSSSTYAGD